MLLVNALLLSSQVVNVAGFVEVDDVVVKATVEAEMQRNSLPSEEHPRRLGHPVVVRVVREHRRQLHIKIAEQRTITQQHGDWYTGC